jgi:hypothetical protein
MSPLESLVAALLHSLWQGGAAFLFVAAALWIVPARKAQLRYTLCLAALAGTLLSCVATWAVLDVKASVQARMRQNVASGVSLSGRAELPLAAMDGGRGGNGGFSAAIPRASSASRAAEVPKPTAQYLYLPMLRFPAIGMREWTGRIAAAWLCGVALFLIRMARGLLGADRLRNDAREVTSPQFLGMARELIREMGLERQLAAARFLVSTHVSIPAVIGFVRPSVLIPASMLLGVPQDYLRAVLAHEFAHIARWDYLVNIGQMLIEALLFLTRLFGGSADKSDVSARHAAMNSPRHVARPAHFIWRRSSHAPAMPAGINCFPPRPWRPMGVRKRWWTAPNGCSTPATVLSSASNG